MIYIKKKYLILTIIILIIIITSLLYIFIKKQNQKSEIKTIEAEILLIGSDYLLVTSNDEIDYIIYTKELNYNIGDTIKLEITDIDKTKSPYEAIAKTIRVISKSTIENKTNEEVNSNNQENNENNNKTETHHTNNEENVIEYFESLDTELTNYNVNDETLGQKIKSKFVSCIDFIFYDKEINGITFNELSNTAKLKILEIALSIDSKIDSKFPNYKETISSTYQDIKSKIIEKYLDITTSICNNDKELCNTAKENFKSIKDNFGITWNFIKELVSSNTSKIKDWYEIWRYN